MTRRPDTPLEQSPSGRRRLAAPGPVLIALIPLLASTILVVMPGAAVVWRAVTHRGVQSDGAVLEATSLLRPLGRTVIACGAIALLATLLALPAGWLMRWASARRLGALVLVPMLLPSYLSYAGWGLLRAPRTYLGDRLADAPRWVAENVGPALAVWGLALWSWPLAALVIGAAARRLDQAVLDTLELDTISRFRRRLTLTRMMLPGIASAVLLVALMMLGSLVPLDVAGLDTYSITLLRWVTLHPSDLPAWGASWPLLLIALAATLAIVRLRAPDVTAPEPARAPARAARIVLWACALLVWGLAVVVPGVLFLLNLREPPHAPTAHTIWRFLAGFWRDSGNAVLASLSVSARVALAALVVALAAWYGVSGRGWSRRLGVAGSVLLVFAGLVPGLLVGIAIRRGSDAFLPALGDSSWIVVAAHLARFAFVGVLVGLWLGRREARDEHDLRRLDGATGPRGFAHACLARHWGTLLGAALAVGILSFHEIEATVQVVPPGLRSLAQETLDALHLARDERLAAASVNLIAAGAALAYLAGWLLLRPEIDRPGASRGAGLPPG